MTDPYAVRPGPMPFRILLDEAMRQTRRHFKAIYLSVAIPVAILTTLAAVAQAASYQDLVVSGESNPLFWDTRVIVVALVLGILSVFAYAAAQVATFDAVAGRPVDMKRAWSFAVRPIVWGTLLLSGLVMLASLVLCILPVFYVAPLLSFTLAAMLEEGRYGSTALSRSAELARFNPGGRLTESPIVKLLVLMLVATIISVMVGWLVSLPFQIPMLIDVFRKAMEGQEDPQATMARWIWFQVPGQFLSSLAQMAVYLYSAFGTALLFFDVRGRKEGTDLRPEFDAMFPGNVPPVPSTPMPGDPWP